MDTQRYDAILDQWIREEDALSQAAEAAGNERERSLALMRRNMYDGMLRVLGKKSLAAMRACAQTMLERSEIHRAADDFDAADRVLIQKAAIERAMAAAIKAGAEEAKACRKR